MNPTPSPSARRLPALDSAFLSLESRAMPMHVGLLQIFSLPAGAPADFIKRIVQRFRNPVSLAPPWNLRLAKVPLARLAPAVIETADIDFGYHVRHAALPEPGGERELGELISHLHAVPLDRSRPLWTCHVIEGLHDNRFAIYIKMHHALTDGMKAMGMVATGLSTDPTAEPVVLWEARAPGKTASAQPPASAPAAARQSARDWTRELSRAFKPMFRREPGVEPVVRPFEAPRSILNGELTNARRVATQQLGLLRVKHLAKKAGVSLNDVFLALCSAALRRHLLSLDALPQQALVANVPVSLRQQGDTDSGNAVGMIQAALASDLADPRERLAAIRASMEAAKNHLKSLSPRMQSAYTMATAMPSLVLLTLGLTTRMRPWANVTISNVPGPGQILYLGGARMEALYPVSIPNEGQVLNITCVSYAGQLNVGFTGSRDSLPHLQKIAVYLGEALDELEAVYA